MIRHRRRPAWQHDGPHVDIASASSYAVEVSLVRQPRALLAAFVFAAAGCGSGSSKTDGSAGTGGAGGDSGSGGTSATGGMSGQSGASGTGFGGAAGMGGDAGSGGTGAAGSAGTGAGGAAGSALKVISFAAPVTYGSMPQDAVTLADLNKDGKLDIAVSNFNLNTVTVFLNGSTVAGALTFSAAVDTPVSASPIDIVSGDFDGDGNMDIAVAVTAAS